MRIWIHWRQRVTIVAAILINLVGVYSLYTLHRSGFFVIPESEAVTDTNTISASSSCTAVNDVITPTGIMLNIVPTIASDGSTSSIDGVTGITNPVIDQS